VVLHSEAMSLTLVTT